MKIIREFDLDCVFLMSEIMDKMDIGIDADNIIKRTKMAKLENSKDAAKLGKEIVVSIGAEMIANILRNLHKAKPEVKALVEALTGEPPERISKMNLKDMKQFFIALTKVEGFEDFLLQAGE